VTPLLEIEGLSVEFRGDTRAVRVVDDVSLTIAPAETVCLVGESGSGKSVTALSIARLLAPGAARIQARTLRLAGEDVLALSDRKLTRIRGRVVSYVFQEPAGALNPVRRIGDQIIEVLRRHRPAEATAAEAIRLLKSVGIPAPEARLRDHAHQLSGGMQQRVVLALALAAGPKLLVADEPTTALDVTVQAQIMDLLARLRSETGMAILLITHNLGLAGQIADRIAVMYAGQIVETGRASEVLTQPRHPYTRALRAAVPQPGEVRARLAAIPGQVPSPGDWPEGCRFAARCSLAVDACRTAMPPLENTGEGRLVRCPRWAVSGADGN
jgi:oligopeptide/dipeptide ABC transporter ATP-binding protein